MPGRRKLRVVAQHTATELGNAIAHMSQGQLACRDFGHAWRPYTVEYLGQRRQYLEALRCTRCRTMRLRLLGERGELLGNRYVYSDGYLVEGIGRLDSDDRDALRLASLQVMLEGLPGQRMAQASGASKSQAS